MAVYDVIQELKWIKNLLEEMGINMGNDPIPIMEDNIGCIFMATNPVQTSKHKHIEMRYHTIRDYVKEGFVEMVYCPTEEMIADVLKIVALCIIFWLLLCSSVCVVFIHMYNYSSQKDLH